MRLRNKKTGEYGRLKMCHDGDKYPLYIEVGELGIYYHNFAEMIEAGWECYIDSAEPLIKDEKIRNAVRAWAEVNNRDLFRIVNEHFNCCKIIGYTDGGDTSCDKIEFATTIAGSNRDYYYTIAELCGEEEKKK